MNDDFEGMTPGLTSPAIAAQEIIPADGRELDYVSRALYVGSGGDLSVESSRGDVVTFRNVPSGAFLPIRVRRVRNSDTTASDIVSLW